MSELQTMYRRQLKILGFIIVLSLCAALLSPYKAVFQGFLLGALVSVYSLWILGKKVVQLSETVARGETARSIGTFSRMALVGLAVIITLQNPEQFHLLSVVFGVVTSYIVIMIDFFIHKFIRDEEKR